MTRNSASATKQSISYEFYCKAALQLLSIHCNQNLHNWKLGTLLARLKCTIAPNTYIGRLLKLKKKHIGLKKKLWSQPACQC